jgi:hypothetical protein
MGTPLNEWVENGTDLRRAGSRTGRARLWRSRRSGAVSAAGRAAVRLAHPAEGRTLRRLAQLDDAPELAGVEILVATVEADVVAALSLDDGRVVANPFVYTADAVELLRGHAAALSGRRRRRRFALRPRLA